MPLSLSAICCILHKRTTFSFQPGRITQTISLSHDHNKPSFFQNALAFFLANCALILSWFWDHFDTPFLVLIVAWFIYINLFAIAKRSIRKKKANKEMQVTN